MTRSTKKKDRYHVCTILCREKYTYLKTVHLVVWNNNPRYPVPDRPERRSCPASEKDEYTADVQHPASATPQTETSKHHHHHPPQPIRQTSALPASFSEHHSSNNLGKTVPLQAIRPRATTRQNATRARPLKKRGARNADANTVVEKNSNTDSARHHPPSSNKA